MESLSDQLKQTLAGTISSISREAEHTVIDAIACNLHNNGYGVEGNTAAFDEEWFACALWVHFHGEVPGRWDGQPAAVKEHWLKISKASIETLPGLMSRIAHRAVLHSQALRTIERGYRAQIAAERSQEYKRG